MEKFVISDLHIYDGSEADEFKKETDLREFLKSIPNNSLILNGDILELKKDKSVIEIVHTRGSLLAELFEKAMVYVAGNHDRSMLNSSFVAPEFYGVPIVKQVIIDGILFMHGDMFDTACNENNAQLGETLTGITGWLAENISPEANKIARNLEEIARSIGRNGDPVSYRNQGLSFIEHFWIENQRLRGICMGHTHQAGHSKMNDRIEYWNSGCWIGGKMDRTRIL